MDRISLRAWGWIAPIGITILAFVLRIWHVGRPNSLTFDETYYAKDAWGLLQWGYAHDAAEDANERIMRGDLDVFTRDPTWIVHPDGGKWLIAVGEWMFGLTPLGWRFAAVVVGSLTTLVLARLVLRLTGSLALACVGGLLWALDGVSFTMSRIALLDGFLAFWLVCAVACLVADRDQLTERLRVNGDFRFWRPWLFAAGACFGMAVATKWSGLYVLAAFGLTVVGWELWARYRAGYLRSIESGVRSLFAVGIPAFFWLVVVALVVYLFTWTGWLVHHGVYEARFGHGYGEDNPPWGAYVDNPTGGPFGGIIDAFRSLWNFHAMTYRFHTGEYLAGKTHPYQSNPIGWMLQWRPTNVASNFDIAAAECGAPADSKCVSQVLILGNPAVWWVGAAASFTALIAWIRKPTWRWSVPLVAIAATWLPWFTVGSRPIFSFYAVTILPFMIVATCLVLNALRRRLEAHVWWTVVGTYLVVVVMLFVYFHPIWSNSIISWEAWDQRMWFKRWI